MNQRDIDNQRQCRHRHFYELRGIAVRGRMGQSQNGNDAITEIYREGPCSGNTESNTDDNQKPKKVTRMKNKHTKTRSK